MRHFLIVGFCAILTCCNLEQSVETKIHDNVNGVDLVIEHYSGPALSQSEDKLYVIMGDEKKLIFEGYGGSSLLLPPLKSGFLVVAYCGGSIRNVASFIKKKNFTGEINAVKVQPIVTSGIQINGKSVCVE